MFPAAYVHPAFGGIFNPYFGGFGHLNKPVAGAGLFWPAFTFPFNLQSPALYAQRAGFLA
jgi:hypothetical protein